MTDQTEPVPGGRRGNGAIASPPPDVVGLDDPRALDAALAGAKAANLARAAVGGMPVLPGFALTTRSFTPTTVGRDGAHLDPTVVDALRRAWAGLTDEHGEPLVVRSSSTIEDVGESSMAGQFTSVLDVSGWEAFLAAVRTVLTSARTATPGRPPLPMAVLVQRQLDADCGGVLFGLDPVSGDPDQVMVEVVPGGPEKLVSGTATAASYHLGRRGKLLDTDDPDQPPRLDRHRRHELATLARRAGEVFDRPQDVEWAYDRDGRLWLLQSRPVTAAGTLHTASGPVLGPGPVGETFPDPLEPLEEDLWISPLHDGIIAALRVTGVATERRIRTSPVVLTVGRRVACDLQLLGVDPEQRSAWHWLDPRGPAQRVRASWRVGRLRAMLPQVARQELQRVDAKLAAVPPLDQLTDDQLVGLLHRTRSLLVSIHGHEVLAGTLLSPKQRPLTGAGLGLAAVTSGQERGWTDEQIIARSPVALALLAPRLGRTPALPKLPSRTTEPADVVDLSAREGLRLRARWAQELTVRAAQELGRRLHDAGRIPTAASVAWIRLGDLDRLISSVNADVAVAPPDEPGPPLPAAFRLTETGGIAAIARPGDRAEGRGAGGGRGEGPVVHGTGDDPPPAGSVLVVQTLDPELAGVLPDLAGLVSETGSTLSHLAILAREYGVPTVVAVPDAVRRYPEGESVLVDGDTGEVRTTGATGGSPHDDGVRSEYPEDEVIA